MWLLDKILGYGGINWEKWKDIFLEMKKNLKVT